MRHHPKVIPVPNRLEVSLPARTTFLCQIIGVILKAVDNYWKLLVRPLVAIDHKHYHILLILV